MAFTVFTDTGKVCLGFTWNAIGVSICAHFTKTTPSAADFLALATEFADAWDTHMKPNQSDDIALGDCVAYDLSAEDAPTYTYTGVNGNAGTVLVDSLPNNTAAVVSHRTASRGRSGRGRNYIPGLTENNVQDGLLQAATVTALLADWASIVSAVALVGWDLVVAQRFADGVQLTTGVTRDVTSELMSTSLGTQRRRQA